MLCFRMEIGGHLKSAFDDRVPPCHSLTVGCMSIFVLIGPKWTHFQNFLGRNDLNLAKMHAAFHPDKRPSARKAGCLLKSATTCGIAQFGLQGRGSSNHTASQFGRDCGVAIVRSNAKLNLSWLTARRQCMPARPTTVSTSWFAANMPEGYGTFKQFINGRDYAMP